MIIKRIKPYSEPKAFDIMNHAKKIWLVTDTHFNHKNIIEYENRPIDFKEKIISNVKDVVKPDDILLHLGDVIFSRASELTEIMGQMPGIKILVKGNHDIKKDLWYFNHGFDLIADTLLFKDIVFSHEPRDLNEYENYKYNIHGHFHRSLRTEASRTAAGYNYYSKFHAYLSIEEEDYKPILLDDFMDENFR